ncbi:MAG: isoprenylcysteine carboxylmethyltransferase family protein [Candidatus Omnitrophica bacterium]|nr:isoprenylcysteine carboxylmethyltransferase family protein [Candidatus Omnitrophota bacterium]
MKKRIKINGFIIFFACVLIAAFPSRFLRLHKIEYDILFQIAGMLIMLLGITFRAASRGFKSEHSGSGKSLVVSGPYSIVRNPMYLGISCIALGVILIMFQWWVLVVFAGFFISRYITLIYKEEKLLKSSFGQQYDDYQKKVPRLIPNLGSVISGKFLRCLSLKAGWIKKELNSIIPLLVVTFSFILWKGFFRS